MSFWDLPTQIGIFCAVVAAVLGAVLGSFLNCAAFRVARRESFVRGHSRCPNCGHMLGALDLVPVLSFVFLRGKCRYCHEKISPRYAVTELLFSLLTVACLLRFGLTVIALRNLVFLACLFMLSLVDLEICEIPDGCLLTAVIAYLAAEPFLWSGWGDFLRRLAAALVYGGGVLLLSLVMDRVLKKESLGGGDIKLLAVAALYLGFIPTLFALILSCVLGLAQASLSGRLGGRAFPFGPAISAAAAIMLFCGEGLASWYLSLF